MQVYYPQDDTLMYFVQWHNSVFMSHFDIKYMERKTKRDEKGVAMNIRISREKKKVRQSQNKKNFRVNCSSRNEIHLFTNKNNELSAIHDTSLSN